MKAYENPRNMSEEERSQIVTAAFCAFIMHKELLTQPEAMRRMAQLTMLTQMALFPYETRGKQ